jgi:hypothetical protein
VCHYALVYLTGQCRRTIGDMTINGSTPVSSRFDAVDASHAVFTALLLASEVKRPHSTTALLCLLFPPTGIGNDTSSTAGPGLGLASQSSIRACALDPDIEWCLRTMQTSLRFIVNELPQKLT